MISIISHLARPDAEKHLESLAIKHWWSLNQKLNSGKYRANSLVSKMEKHLSMTEAPGYFLKYANGDHGALLRQRSLYQAFLDFDNFILYEAITSNPEGLISLRAEIMNIITEDDLYTTSNGLVRQTEFGRLLSDDIFAYALFRGSAKCTALLSDIQFKSATCPYCNTTILDIVENFSGHKIALSTAYMDIDHFFSKVQNPFFAVSFFNLIPSCHSCNSIDKGAKEFSLETHVHPYCESFDDLYKFRISLISILGDPIDFIHIDSTGTKPLDRTLADFNLQDRYNNKLDEAKRLVELFVKYKWTFGNPEQEMFIELLLNGIPLEKGNILRHPAAKLKRDLLIQLDVNAALKFS